MGKPNKLLRFLVGCCLVGSLFWWLSRTTSPEDSASLVLKNNVEKGIDATPLFYTEVDNMPVLLENSN